MLKSQWESCQSEYQKLICISQSKTLLRLASAVVFFAIEWETIHIKPKYLEFMYLHKCGIYLRI